MTEPQSKPEFSIETSLRALKDAIATSSSNDALFQATKKRKDLKILDGNGFTVQVVKTGYTEPAPPGKPPRLPNLAFDISFPDAKTDRKFTPFVSWPSGDAAENKAAFLVCIEYFLKNPNTSTHTARVTTA